MNSKSPSTSCDSLNSILQKANNENLYRHMKDTSHDLINIENIDPNLLNYLNNELINSGYQSIQYAGSAKINYNRIFENSIDIISRYNRQLAAFNRSQEQNYKLDHENEMLLKRQQSLKDINEGTLRELANVEEKFRQATSKSSTLSKTVKELTDENRKLHNTIEQRDKQYKHERKKLEKENNRLKERVQVLTTGKTKDLPNIDLSESIHRKSVGGSRATWNNDGSKKQIELYSELIKDYDRKNKELIIENTELKTCLSDTFFNLAKSLKVAEKDNHETANAETSVNSSKCYNQDDETDPDRLLADEVARQPFDNVYSKLNKQFQAKFELIKDKSQKCLEQENSIHTLNSNINNLTISSINSYSTKILETTNDEEILNATFTIDDTEKHSKKSNNYFMDKNVSSSTSSSSASPPSMSLLTEHLEKIHNSNKAHSPGKAKKGFVKNCEENSLFSEQTTLQTERKKLALEKKHFYEQKLKLEQEATACHKISNELAKKQNDFQDEQEKYYQAKLFSSFTDQSQSSNNYSTPGY